MGVRAGGSSNKTFLGVYSNQLVFEYTKKEDLEKKLEALGFDPEQIQVRQKTSGKNEGQDVYYFVVYELDGRLVDARLKENDWGEFLELEFDDVGERFIVSLGDVFQRIAKDFARRVGNIDLNNEMKFGVWGMTKEETGSSARSGVKIYQDGEKVDYFVAYEDMPEPEKKKKGGKDFWDYTEQENFLYETLKAWIAENFKPQVEEKPAEKPKAEKKPARKPRGKKTEEAVGVAKSDLPWEQDA